MGRDSRLALTVALFVFAWLVPVSASSQEVTLRIAANVPANSPWDLGLKRMAAAFDSESNGRVRVEFPRRPTSPRNRTSSRG